jgi:ABC-type multidrug transport system fused ATPase/permease subunit
VPGRGRAPSFRGGAAIPYFFQTSLRENLLLVRTQASDEEIRHTCEQAHAWDFIRDLADGLDTRVGEAGSNLSGGQRQRLAIARVLLMEPPFFYLR